MFPLEKKKNDIDENVEKRGEKISKFRGQTKKKPEDARRTIQTESDRKVP